MEGDEVSGKLTMDKVLECFHNLTRYVGSFQHLNSTVCIYNSIHKDSIVFYCWLCSLL